MALEIIESSRIKTAWSTKQCISLAIISLLFGIIIFVFAYIGMRQNTGIGVFNQPVLSWMISSRDPQVTTVMKLITEIANPIVFAIIIFIGVGSAALIKREVWRPFLLICSTIFAAIVSTLLKIITTNSRPPQIDMIMPFEIDYSFPSGHTIGVLVFLLVLSYLIYSRNSSFKRFFNWNIITIIGVGMVAVSRLYLGYHWLTDVVASIGLGFIILALVIFIDRIVISRFKQLE